LTQGGSLKSTLQKDEYSTSRILWGVLTRAERRNLLVVFLLTVIGAFLETLSVAMLFPLLSVLSSDSNLIVFPFFEIAFDRDLKEIIRVLVFLLFFTYVVKNAFLGFSAWIQRGFLTKITARLSSRILEIYVTQPYQYHLSNNSSVLIRNTQDASRIVASGVEPSLTIMAEGLVAFVLLLFMLSVEPLGTLCTLSLMLFAAFLIQMLFNRRLKSWGSSRQLQKARILKIIQQALGSVKDVRILGREDWFIKAHREMQFTDANLLRRINLAQAIPRLFLEVTAISGLSVLIFVMFFTGSEVGSIAPTVGLFAATAFRVLPSINKIVNAKQSLKVDRTTFETIHHDLGLSIAMKPSKENVNFQFENVVVDRLDFKYEQSENLVLSNINVKILSGEAVGFVGQSGSGKSTLIDIMLGLLEPQSGSVLINRQTIENVKQSWQKQIGYIPQTIFLMDDSLRRNVAIGIADTEIDEVAIVEALKSAQLEDFVASLPEGLDTVVGERGVRLSGGQRQRIGIARALYHRPSVLVLDEATSSLDTETEKDVMQAVQALQGDKTVIIVAHRLSTVEYCDRLYRLDAGRIVDEGTFDEVMNRSQS
jgi:ABC-type multidrug transport system fused ATPase/permease subunit